MDLTSPFNHLTGVSGLTCPKQSSFFHSPPQTCSSLRALRVNKRLHLPITESKGLGVILDLSLSHILQPIYQQMLLALSFKKLQIQLRLAPLTTIT